MVIDLGPAVAEPSRDHRARICSAISDVSSFATSCRAAARSGALVRTHRGLRPPRLDTCLARCFGLAVLCRARTAGGGASTRPPPQAGTLDLVGPTRGRVPCAVLRCGYRCAGRVPGRELLVEALARGRRSVARLSAVDVVPTSPSFAIRWRHGRLQGRFCRRQRTARHRGAPTGRCRPRTRALSGWDGSGCDVGERGDRRWTSLMQRSPGVKAVFVGRLDVLRGVMSSRWRGSEGRRVSCRSERVTPAPRGHLTSMTGEREGHPRAAITLIAVTGEGDAGEWIRTRPRTDCG